MGGAAAGEIASAMARRRDFQPHDDGLAADRDHTRSASPPRSRGVEVAQPEIHAFARSTPRSAGMGTTATVAGVLGDPLYLARWATAGAI